jgi:hypothetical protein
MVPFKHLQTWEQNRAVLSIALARLHLEDKNIPIVAASYRNKISISYWSAPAADGIENWQTLFRDHAEIRFPSDSDWIKEQSPASLSNMEWSGEIGLAVVGDCVFLFYKRSLPSGEQGLFIEKMNWDSGSNLLRTDGPVRIPIDDFNIAHIGFQLWAGNVTDRIALVTQTWKRLDGVDQPELTVFIAGDPCRADLSLAGSWNPIKIGDGGWDFDAKIANEKLYLLFRRQAYPLELNANIEPNQIPSGFGTVTCEPVRVDLSSEDLYDGRYHTLLLASVNVFAANVEGMTDSIPGGEHPQIHSLDPLCISLDRIRIGTISIVNQYVCDPHHWWQTRKRWLLIDKDIKSYVKILIRRQVGLWAIGSNGTAELVWRRCLPGPCFRNKKPG